MISAILSRLLAKYEASGNAKALALIKKISPAAWRHIHLNGRYIFRGDGQIIDLDAIVAGLELAWRNFLGFGLTCATNASSGLKVDAMLDER